MLRTTGFEGMMWLFPRCCQMSLLPVPAAVCSVGFLQKYLCSFPVPLRSKHPVWRWPVAKVRLSEAGGVGIRVSLRTGLAVSLWPGVKFSLRPTLGFTVRSELGFVGRCWFLIGSHFPLCQSMLLKCTDNCKFGLAILKAPQPLPFLVPSLGFLSPRLTRIQASLADLPGPSHP